MKAASAEWHSLGAEGQKYWKELAAAESREQLNHIKDCMECRALRRRRQVQAETPTKRRRTVDGVHHSGSELSVGLGAASCVGAAAAACPDVADTASATPADKESVQLNGRAAAACPGNAAAVAAGRSSTLSLVSPSASEARRPSSEGCPPVGMSAASIQLQASSPRCHQPPVCIGEFVMPPDARVLGRGSYGTVVRVEHRMTRRRFAAKLFRCPIEAAAEVDVYKRLAQATHASFQELHAFSLGRVLSWLITPWCEAGSLQSCLREGGRIGGAAHVLGFANQVRSGLDHLHRSVGFLHLDIKPGNILWSCTTAHAYIIDFSLAVRWPLPSETDVCPSHCCTEPYRPPELHCKSAPLDRLCPAVDTWSLGVTVAEAALGKDLFFDPTADGSTISSTRHLVHSFLKDREGFLRQLVFEPVVEELLLSFLKGDPSQRRSLHACVAVGALDRPL